MAVVVIGQRDRRVPHHCLDNLGVNTSLCHPSAACMPQGVEVQNLAFVVHNREKSTLLAFQALCGILFGGLDPGFPCRACATLIAQEELPSFGPVGPIIDNDSSS